MKQHANTRVRTFGIPRVGHDFYYVVYCWTMHLIWARPFIT
ncbi:hypothetical protein BURCENBC7_AP2753 [Burkholderia cenocepacia BC7]|nr:uncharacterized protein BCN122_II1517 [Burkholderia cenocepacia]EPZ88392.1 hypothetical protein BURCENK562V_C3545 [Burkholderia cenocepacia K56-2Valvano]ERI29828.1 hypothetical protein BURCENBC7_AP2753 [Burkholderia cenocepacia BC7]CDN63161.1 hypothetical protein I35_5325 [Burkholderia cenocepacia H111]